MAGLLSPLASTLSLSSRSTSALTTTMMGSSSTTGTAASSISPHSHPHRSLLNASSTNPSISSNGIIVPNIIIPPMPPRTHRKPYVDTNLVRAAPLVIIPSCCLMVQQSYSYGVGCQNRAQSMLKPLEWSVNVPCYVVNAMRFMH
jgi:hypothetical protein